MTHRSTETDFKANIADLTKIPPNEFEKHFHEWMERDDVARSLQAKLRCDLIKNFNKTNLGKHITSHTMTASGGSSMRLTLSPLILALNTLVAEFLYAQNCHFTLSVFCTEIPFRNTLPDFESSRNFRFNKTEIAEIWEAVTGSIANAKDLNKFIIQNYETNPNISLLLLIVKCLLEQRPVELLRKSVEIQTETKHTTNRSTSVQTCIEETTAAAKSTTNSPAAKSPSKDDNLHHINNYLLTLSEKVLEMTKEFEQFSKHRNLSRPIKSLRSSRSRDYLALNKSLERISDNLKNISQTKRKNKRLSNIVESIENLTKQFGKCAENFDNVTKILSNRERKSPTPPPVEKYVKTKKVTSKEKQTETDKHEKSYADWIHEMRTTANGQKFLDRVETALRKALTKHQQQLQNETDIKMKHLKSLLKLHYQQKLSKHLLQQEPKENFEENRKLNENIEMKLKQFEVKQMELMKQLEESSNELKEAQRVQKKSHAKSEEEKSPIEENTHDQNVSLEPKLKTTINDIPTPVLRDETNSQKPVQDMDKTIAEEGRSVDLIIYDAKLRMQQLENESNQLEQNFQLYLERRKREELVEQQILQKQRSQTITSYDDRKHQHSQFDLYKPGSSQLLLHNLKSKSFAETEKDEDDEEEFKRIKEKLQEQQKELEKSTNAKSGSRTSSPLELRNAILEAKEKFFKHEDTLRKRKEQQLDLQNKNLLKKQLENLQETFEPYYYNHNFEQYESETNINFGKISENNQRRELNLESSLSEINIKDKTLDEDYEIVVSPMTEQKSIKSPDNQKSASLRRELFPKDEEESKESFKHQEIETKQVNPLELKSRKRYTQHIPLNTKDLQHILSDIPKYKETIENNEYALPETTSQLIKQSMAKMQQLFEQHPKEPIREMVQDIENIPKFPLPESSIKIYQIPSQLEKSLSTTTTSTTAMTTTATTTSSTNEEFELNNQNERLKTVSNLNRISNTSMPSILNLSSESDDSLKSINDEAVTKLKELNQKSIGSAKSFQSSESLETTEYNFLPTPSGSKVENDLEIGENNNSPDVLKSNAVLPGNDMEIGEALSETNRTFAPIDDKLSDISSETSSDLEMSTGHRGKRKIKLSDGSESDFWT